MAKIIESLKKLSMENGVQKHKEGILMKKGKELALEAEEAVSLQQNYILAICGTQSEPEFRIGTALSDHSCIIYMVGETLSRTATLTHNQGAIVGIRFSPISKNIVYIATNNGLITACDLRAKGKVIAEFKDGTEVGKLKPLTSFDVNCDERLVAGGTEHIGGDTFILFWDIRHTNSKGDCKNNLLGGYWESHVEDVTCLAFHPNKSDALASGSTDGLINIFDLTQSSEDSALMYSLNTESPIDRLGWMVDDNLWCTTYTHSLQLWDHDDVAPYAKFERTNLAVLQNDEPDNCYIIKFHPSNALGQPFLLAGSSNAKGENLRCLTIANNQLEMYYNLIGNKQYVRDSWLHEKSGCLITGGENGIINIWRQTEQTEQPSIQQNSAHKMLSKIGTGKTRDRHRRNKPY